MSIDDFLTFLTQITFVLVAALTLADWIWHRDRTRLDIALVFISLAASIVIQSIQRVVGVQAPWLGTVGSLAVMAQPYLLLRIAQYFRPVRPLIQRGALAGLAVSWAALIIFSGQTLLTPITLFIIVYFVIVEVYATAILIQGALTIAGITRQRLRLASAGSGLLAAIILFAGVLVVVPAALRLVVAPLFQVLAILSGLSYYFGFAPPRWLRRAWQLSELHQFLRQTSGRLVDDRAATFEQLSLAALRTVGGTVAVIARWEPAEQHLKINVPGELPWHADSLETESGAIGQAWRERQARVARVPHDIGSETARWAGQVGARTLLIIPIVSPLRPWGLLIVALRYAPLFALDDLDLLTLIAAQSAIALDYTALIEELRVTNQSLERRVAERTVELSNTNRALRTISDCNQVLVRAESEADLLNQICHIIVETGGYRMAWVGYAESDEAKSVRPVAQAGFADGYLNTLNLTWADTEGGRGATGTAIRTGRSMVIQNILAEAPDRANAIERGYRSTVALPLMTDSQILGVLRIYAVEANTFNAEEVKLLTELADDLAYGITALRTQAAHAQAEEEIRQDADRDQALADISRELAAAHLDYQAVLDATARRMTELIGDACNIRLVSDDGQWLEVASLYHPDADALPFLREMLTANSLRADEGLAGRVIQTGQPVLIPVISPEQFKAMIPPAALPILERRSINSLLVVPLRAQGRVLGTLTLTREQPGRSYTVEDQAFLQDLADRAALAIANARLYQDVQRELGERQRAEEALRESEEFYRRLFENIRETLVIQEVVADDTGKPIDLMFLDVNPAAERILGKTRRELVGRTRSEVSGQPDPEGIEMASRVASTGKPFHMVRYSPGFGGWFESYTYSLGSGTVATLALDITERKRAEDLVRQNAARAQVLAELSGALAAAQMEYQVVLDTVARRLVELIGDLCNIHLLSEDGQWFTLAALYHPNPEVTAFFREILTATRNRVEEGMSGQVIQTGQPLLLPVTSSEQIKATLHPKYWPLLERFGVHSLLVVALRAQGRALGVLSMVRNQPGHPYTRDDLVFLQDLADRAALAITNAKLYQDVQRELAERKRAEAQLRVTASVLERNNRELQDFAYVASHDLQEPLRKIQAFGDRLVATASDRLDEKSRDYLQRMHAAAERMQTLINDLLTFSRVTTKAQPFARTDLNQVVKGVLSDLEVRLERSGGRVEADDLPTIDADPTQMRQILQNLIGNALKFYKPGVPPVVKVYSRTPEVAPTEGLPETSQAAIIVEDNGIGFDEKYLDRIFTPFQRLHGRGEYEGTGIGLAVVRKIVERHSGSVTAKSVPGRGATFIVTLPLRQNAASGGPPQAD